MILDKTGGIAFKIGLYRYWDANQDPNITEPSTLSIKEYIISKDCEKIMDKEKCDYKSKDKIARSKYKYKFRQNEIMPEGAKKIKRITSKVVAKEIKFEEMKGSFLAIIKNNIPKKKIKKKGKFYSRDSIKKLRIIDPKWNCKKIDRIVRACYFPPYEQAYYLKSKEKKYLSPEDVSKTN